MLVGIIHDHDVYLIGTLLSKCQTGQGIIIQKCQLLSFVNCSCIGEVLTI